jgi:hypothetical protein
MKKQVNAKRNISTLVVKLEADTRDFMQKMEEATQLWNSAPLGVRRLVTKKPKKGN